MGMVLIHEQAASYAAGSLGGTLGRLNDSLRRLARSRSRDRASQEDDEHRLEPARLAHLHQSLRLMADAWRGHNLASSFGRIERQLEHLKENALQQLGNRRRRPADYQALAGSLDHLRATGLNLM
ncbi:MAG: hypothetical protein LBP55_04510 [Candidatus Adiutrix sp.]|nr:hypothetical protein [Candidatus Adiutrix sp.]